MDIDCWAIHFFVILYGGSPIFFALQDSSFLLKVVGVPLESHFSSLLL